MGLSENTWEEKSLLERKKEEDHEEKEGNTPGARSQAASSHPEPTSSKVIYTGRKKNTKPQGIR